jgi:hypothetical protein
VGGCGITSAEEGAEGTSGFTKQMLCRYSHSETLYLARFFRAVTFRCTELEKYSYGSVFEYRCC